MLNSLSCSMSSPLPIERLKAFLSTGHQTPSPSSLQLHLLRGWRESTLLSYNSAVNKFKAFLRSDGILNWSLPASPDDVYRFCFWAGRTEEGPKTQEVTSKTLQKYLYALQVWHTFHDVPYPPISNHKILVLLRACGRQDALAPSRPIKPAVQLQHLLLLYHTWVNGTDEDRAALDCVLVAFWGMMRLAEVTYVRKDGQPPWLNSVTCRDVTQSSPDSPNLTIAIRGAKTAKAGVAQHVLLNSQHNILCPVSAVRRRLRTMTRPEDALFGYGDQTRVNLTRSRLVSKCVHVWLDHGCVGLSGHSFRVGGASLRAALGVPHIQIQQLGRWTSDCYKLYLRTYSPEELSEACKLLNYLNR